MAAGMRRLVVLILIMAMLETAWALYSVITGVNFFLFYAGLALASIVFWVPGLGFKKQSAADS